MRIVIHGFGRIGRTILRQILSLPSHDAIEVALINDISSLETCTYLFQYDSTFGPFPTKVEADKHHLIVSGRRIPFSRTNDLNGHDLTDVDLILECTGKMPSKQAAEGWLSAGAGGVLVSGPSDQADVAIVQGANEKSLGDARIVANSSCTTNAIAPLLRSLDTALGIERAHVTTIHCYTGSQPMVDGPRGDLARSRAGAESMVPTTTSAANELERILPELASRTTVAAVRVPCLSVSAIDATLQLKSPVGSPASEILKTIAARSSVIGYTEDRCVSRDLRARPESLILALPETMTLYEGQLRVFGWYDNEWGFSARMIEMAQMMASRPQFKEGAHGAR
jgi:glyceraldehyde 3-phosphate dehydrogenase (phosphorylating)